MRARKQLSGQVRPRGRGDLWKCGGCKVHGASLQRVGQKMGVELSLGGLGRRVKEKILKKLSLDRQIQPKD